MKKKPLIQFAALAAFLAIFNSPVFAVLINEGFPTIFDFDLVNSTMQFDPVRTESITFLTDIDIYDVGIPGDTEIDEGSISICDDLGGLGSCWTTQAWSDSSFLTSFTHNEPIWMDGIFSAVYTSISGTINVVNPAAYATYLSGDNTVAISGILHSPSTVVPEPSSLLLMGIGLAGLGFIRLRKRS